MKTEVKSDNRLIAVFMGLTWKTDPIWMAAWFNDSGEKITHNENLYYHNSWDELMPVVEKIENDLLFQVDIHTAYTNINGEFNDTKYNQDSPFEFQYDTKLSVTYRAVVRFLKWFQEQSDNL